MSISERGRQAIAYMGLLVVFWALVLGQLALELLMDSSFWLFSSKWGQELQIVASIALAVYVSHRIGRVSYYGVGLVVLVGISGFLYYMAVSVVGLDYAVQVFADLWREVFLAPVGVACFSLLIIRQLTSHLREGTPEGAP